jgi:hypothetical protein
VPFRLIRELVDTRVDDTTIEILLPGRSVASRARPPHGRMSASGTGLPHCLGILAVTSAY